MAETLFGAEKSGTPMETRGATSDMARMFQQMILGGGFGGEGGRMTSESWMNMLGFDPTAIGLSDAATSALRDPADRTAGLFSAMEPFEQRQTAQQVGGLRDMFGTMGGRFGRNIMEGETQLRGELAGQFGQNRERALLEAGGQRNQALASILGAMGQAGQTDVSRLGVAANFLQPGAPVYTEGLMPGLLGAGANLAGLYMMGNTLSGGGGGGPNAAQSPWATPNRPGPWQPPAWNPTF